MVILTYVRKNIQKVQIRAQEVRNMITGSDSALRSAFNIVIIIIITTVTIIIKVIIIIIRIQTYRKASTKQLLDLEIP